MNLDQLNQRLDEIGHPPTRNQIKELEVKLDASLPPELIRLLEVINGGEFFDDVSFRSIERDLNLDVRGLLRIEPGHLYDFSSCVDRLSDSEVDWSADLPILYTHSSNYFLFGMKDRRVKYWRSDYDQVIDLGIGLSAFFDSLEFQDPLSDFEKACRDFDLNQIRKEPWFEEKADQICTFAAMMGNLNLVVNCIDSGLPTGTAMRAAAVNGRADILDHFIKIGWDINRPDDKGRTLLDWASWDPDCFEIVRARGGKPGEELG